MARAMANLNQYYIMSGYKISSKEKDQLRDDIIKFLEVNKYCRLKELTKKSPIAIPEEPHLQFAAVAQHLFKPDAVLELKLAGTVNGESKASPCGQTFRRRAQDWIELAHSHALNAFLGDHEGVYMRANPVKHTGPGSGASGVTKDSDVASYDHCLVEHDWLKIGLQAMLLSAIALPICAITESGGGSLHALVKVRAEDAELYARETKELLTLLDDHFGFDPTNSNPSRLTRAPGFFRQVSSQQPQLQRLLYLNPNPTFTPISEL